MARTMKATEARIHFGELMQRVVADQEPVIVERSGEPQVVVLSVAHYQRLQQAEAAQKRWQERVDRAQQVIAEDLQGRTLPAVDDVIRQMREERDAELLDLR